ncbi:MAG: hypothetical protein NVS1B4_06170 [Gemmatimonadaceae bacterium]
MENETPEGLDDRNRESALGGADAVEKTTGVTGRGTDPEAIATDRDAPSARVSSGGGFGVGTWVVVAAVLLAALVYAGGAFR